jgi:hypothetical protein
MRFPKSLLLLALLPLENGCMDSTINPIKDPPEEGVPGIQVDPNPVDFGVVSVGETSTQIVSMFSTGDATLNVTAMQIGSGRETFTLVEPLVGLYETDSFAELTITEIIKEKIKSPHIFTVGNNDLQCSSKTPDGDEL